MTDDFLTADQVEKLTGKTRLTAQLRNLTERGLPHDINGRGEVLVLWSVVESRMGIQRPTERAPEPDWGAMYGSQASAR